MSLLIVVLACSLLALAFCGLHGLLWLAERNSPRLARWLDENVGQPGPWS